MPNLFITFEGGDGVGKTTQIALLRRRLEAEGHSVCVTREPGGDPVGERVRDLLLQSNVAGREMDARAELLLFLASRAQNTAQVIRPHLEAGGIVLCDRFIDSSVAYQGYARGIGSDLVVQLNAFATGGLIPDLTFLLDLDPAVGLARQSERNRMEAQGLEFQCKVREGFLAAAANNPARFRVFDATLPPDTLHTAISAEVELRLSATEN